MTTTYNVDVTFDNGTFIFGGAASPDGDIEIPPSRSGEPVTICFNLLGPNEAEWAGIKISPNQNDLNSCAAATDTAPAVYPDTCFVVGPSGATVMPLLDEIGEVATTTFYYCVGVKVLGVTHWQDPRINNPGGNGLASGGARTASPLS